MRHRYSTFLGSKKTRRPAGFTIVELLIGIVVIGILAVVAMSSFTNAQKNSRNASRVTAAKEYYKITLAYMQAYSQYPRPHGATQTSCLGYNYVDGDGDGWPNCFASNNLKNIDYILNTELKKISPTLPDYPAEPVVGTNGITYTGVVHRGMTINGEAGRIALVYYLEGLSMPCGLGNRLTGGLNTVVTAAAGATDNVSGNTQCVIAIPKPEDL
ncbi:type II secretion system protein [Candidatus Saccharibacteria bacterium]|nr:type II secretion system protein [Candidatus Saccharibacteria bacterium]